MIRPLLFVKKESNARISAVIPEGISFLNDFIIVKSGSNMKIFSSRCPHLGCKINRFENDQIVCPCHGSRFSLDGTVLKGPAIKPLESLSYKLNTSSNELIVNVAE